jgi:hypothetical protein
MTDKVIVLGGLAAVVWYYYIKKAPDFQEELEDRYRIESRGVWGDNGPGEYKCPWANGVNKTSYLSEYCVFGVESDVQRHCDGDPACVGYVSNAPDTFMAINRFPVPNVSANGSFYKRGT